MRAIALVSAVLCGLCYPFAEGVELTASRPPGGVLRDEGGVWQVEGAGSLVLTPNSAPAAGETVLEFEYFCVGGVPAFAVLPGPPFQAASARRVPALGHSEGWSTWTARLDAQAPLPQGWKQLRLDLPLPAGRVLQIRKARLRAADGGGDEPVRRRGAFAREADLEASLSAVHPGSIDEVRVGVGDVRVRGRVGSLSGNLWVADIPMDLVVGDARAWETLVEVKPDAAGVFEVTLPRLRPRGAYSHDRLLSRWQLVRRDGGRVVAVSHARHPDEVAPAVPAPAPLRPAGKKGLGGWRRGVVDGELEALGISAVTINVVLQQLVSPAAGPGTVPFTWQGRTWHARQSVLEQFDAALLEAQRHKVMVSAILLVGNPAKGPNPVLDVLGFPDAAKEGVFAMPDVTSEEGAALYGGILNLMAARWCRADGKYGRISHWIVHNEVDAARVWTNAGDKTALEFMDLYQRSMRMVDLIARQYDPRSRAFISLTHHWAEPGNPGWYGSRRLLELLGRFTRAEGDFPWALAYHPYPENLFNPRTWEDRQAVFSRHSPKITPRNLEVLDDWMKDPARRYRGEVRPVHLSENGFNSKDYSTAQLADQVAGMAYAWKKIRRLTSIEVWHYHNWIDNRAEGGLRIGLRRFADDAEDPLGPKPIWHLYRALGTADEDRACAPYLKTIGIPSWDAVVVPHPVQR